MSIASTARGTTEDDIDNISDSLRSLGLTSPSTFPGNGQSDRKGKKPQRNNFVVEDDMIHFKRIAWAIPLPNPGTVRDDAARAISDLESMGFERSAIDSAMRAAFYNSERAIEYLVNVCESRPDHQLQLTMVLGIS